MLFGAPSKSKAAKCRCSNQRWQNEEEKMGVQNERADEHEFGSEEETSLIGRLGAEFLWVFAGVTYMRKGHARSYFA